MQLTFEFPVFQLLSHIDLVFLIVYYLWNQIIALVLRSFFFILFVVSKVDQRILEAA